MHMRAHIRLAISALVATVFAANPAPAGGEDPSVIQEITAHARVLPEVGPGVIALKHDAGGHYYILKAPPTAVAIYGADGKLTGQIPNANSRGTKIIYAEDFDVDSSGRLYVADRGGNAVKIFGADGSLEESIPVVAPFSVASLSGGECAVVALRADRLVTIFDASGKMVGSFGDVSELAEHGDPDQRMNRGRLSTDSAGHVYFAFMDLPEPTIRKYDRYGYAAYEISVSPADLASGAAPEPHEFVTFEQRNNATTPKAIHAIGVDPVTQEVWASIGNDLLHFDKDGNPVADYRTAANDGARIESDAILIEPGRILLASTKLGIFEFARPDKRPAAGPQ